jgi:hypothetical protein
VRSKISGLAVKLADHWRDLPQSVRGEILQIAVDAKPEIFERTLKDVATERDRSRRQEMLTALASVRDPGRQKAALGLMLDDRIDKRETLGLLFGGGALRGRGGGGGTANDDNLQVSQAFFREHQDAIIKTMPQDGTAGPFARLSGLFTQTCDADQRDAIADYVKKTFGQMAGAKRILSQNLEAMDQCIERKKLVEPEIRAWLSGARVVEKTKP